MNGVPNQEEIDALAHFVEAVRELKHSPFFMEEHRSLGITWVGHPTKDTVHGKFPDHNVVKSALVPFRRVWHQSEPCHHARVTNILRRYEPAHALLLDPILFNENGSIAKSMAWLKDCDLTPYNVIHLWLNTRYHHVGKGKAGRFTRADFERYETELGPVLLEFYFLQTVTEIGTSFFNIEICASRFLEILALEGLKPSFSVSTSNNAKIERSTPGFTREPDSPRQKVWRLRRRRHYDGVNRFFQYSDLSDEAIANAVAECETFDEFANCCGFTFEHSDRFEEEVQNDDAIVAASGCIDNHFTAVKNRHCRRGFIAKRGRGSYLVGEDFLPVVRDQYSEFRIAYLKECFE